MLTFAAEAWNRFWQQRAINRIIGVQEDLSELFRIPDQEEINEQEAMLFGVCEKAYPTDHKKMSNLNLIGLDISGSTLSPDPTNSKLFIYDHLIDGWQKCLASWALNSANTFMIPYAVNSQVWQLSDEPVPTRLFINYALKRRHFLHRNEGGLLQGGSDFYSFLRVALLEAIEFTKTPTYQENPIPVTVTLLCDGEAWEDHTSPSTAKKLLKEARERSIVVAIRGFVRARSLPVLNLFLQNMEFTKSELFMNVYGFNKDTIGAPKELSEYIQASDNPSEAIASAFQGVSDIGTVQRPV